MFVSLLLLTNIFMCWLIVFMGRSRKICTSQRRHNTNRVQHAARQPHPHLAWLVAGPVQQPAAESLGRGRASHVDGIEVDGPSWAPGRRGGSCIRGARIADDALPQAIGSV